MRTSRLLMALGATLCALLAAMPAAWAQPWPARPVRILVAFPAGGGTDATARAYAEKLSQELGQQFVVENRVGASGAIGHEACAKAANDGYTLCVNTLGALGLLPNLRKTPYDPLKDFTAIGRVTDALFAFASHPSRPWKTMQEFIALAKASPGKFTLANSGPGTITHLAGETMAAGLGLQLIMVPYKGGVEQLQDALAGHVDMMYEGNVFPHIKAGKLVGLAVSTPFRHPHFPEIPTMKEILPSWDLPSWFAFMAPAGIPADIPARLSPILNRIGEMPDVRERVLAMGLVPIKDTPADLARDLPLLHARFGATVKRLNIKVD